MARPRVFISSTFYDLRQVRQDLERFIKGLGYEAIRHETGAIPYGKEKRPESFAYQEVDGCDILIAIIGGRFGNASQEVDGYSISQAELKRALEQGTPVYIFVEKSTYAEFGTYRLNKDNDSVKYQYVDDTRIFTFIEEVLALPQNNPVAPFETSDDIVTYLQQQWAGLFQRLLQEKTREEERRVLEQMKSVATTLEKLVPFFTAQRKSDDSTVRDILSVNHPAFERFRKLTVTPYRVYFLTKAELDTWMKAKSWKAIDAEHLDEDSHYEWINNSKYIKVTEPIFDNDGTLKFYDTSTWEDDWITKQDVPDDGSSDS